MKNKYSHGFLICLIAHYFLISSCVFAADNQQTSSEVSCDDMRIELNGMIADLVEPNQMYEKYQAWLTELRKDQDDLTVAMTKLAGGPAGLLTIDQSKTCDREALKTEPKILDNETKIACMNLGLAEIQKRMDQAKKDIASWNDKRKECLDKIVVVQKRMIAAGCKDVGPPNPKNTSSNTASTQATQPITQASLTGLDVHPFDELLYDLMELADETPDVKLFIGKWSGSAKITKSNQPDAVGISQTYFLEIIRIDDKTVSLASNAGVIGKPELYQTKIDGNHLRVDYSGPFETPGLPQVQTNLTYTLDVTLKDAALRGQVSMRSEALYEGKSTVKEILMEVVLKKK